VEVDSIKILKSAEINLLNSITHWESFLFKGSVIDPAVTSVHSLFEQQAKETSKKTAIVFDNTLISYENLNNKANQLAHLLINCGLKKETIVGIYLERGIQTLVSLLAVLKAGGAFLLIDKKLPDERVKYIINDSQLSLLLVDNQDSLNHPLQKKYFSTPIINIHDGRAYPKHNPNISVTGNNMAYVIYTSGTTGKPKGVMIEHKGIINTLLNQIEILKIKDNDKVLCASPVSFDAFIWEIGGALLSGAEIHLTTRKERTHIRKLGFLINQHQITIATLTPSILRTIPDNFLSSLRILVSAGEACTFDLIKKVSKECQFYNGYGPTETSICATISHCNVDDNNITLGLPLKNIVAYALKDNFEKANIGEIGTLYIGGLGLARGYLNNPDLTNKFFINNPFPFQSHLVHTLYNTGDLVRVNKKGSFVYIGRKDTEVKICGNRVNLNEIQCLLSQYPRIHNSLVTVQRSHKKHKYKIIATIETDDESIDFMGIKNYLLEFLPAYMLPSKLIKTKQLPLSYNGKLLQR